MLKWAFLNLKDGRKTQPLQSPGIREQAWTISVSMERRSAGVVGMRPAPDKIYRDDGCLIPEMSIITQDEIIIKLN